MTILLFCLLACPSRTDPDLDADEDGWTAAEGDCDDDHPGRNPAAREDCDDVDDDCDGLVDADDPNLDSFGWLDADGDGSPGTWGRICAANTPDDCDDEDTSVHPGAADELCDGLDSNCDGNGAAPAAAGIGEVEFATVSAALDAVLPGERIEVCPGTWVENLAVSSGLEDVTLASLSGSPEDTILDGGGARPVITNESVGLTLEGLTLQNGLGRSTGGLTTGGAIDGLTGSGLTIRDSVLRANQSTEAVLTAGPGSFLVSDTVFTENDCGSGHLVFLWDPQLVDLADTRIAGNACPGHQMAVYANDVELTFERVTLRENNDGEATYPAVYLTAADRLAPSSATVTIAESELVFNGGQVFLASRLDAASLFVRDSVVQDNDGGTYYSAFQIEEHHRIESLSTDWGDGPTDNDPYDLTIGSANYDFWGEATFVCEPYTPCDEEPPT